MPEKDNGLEKDYELFLSKKQEEEKKAVKESKPLHNDYEIFLENQYNTEGQKEVDIDITKYQPYMSDFGVHPSQDINEQRALGQSGWEQLGHATANFANEAIVGSLQSIASIPDTFYNLYAIADGEKKLFENDLAALLRETKEDISEAAPIYREQSSEGFSPMHGSWWADNAGSIASALTFIVPTRAIGGAAGMTAKMLGKLTRGVSKTKGVKWMDDLAVAMKHVDMPSAKVAQLGKSLEQGMGRQVASIMGGTLYSNAAESFQEAVPMAMQKYEEAIAAGKSEEEATQIMAQVGRDAYTSNFINAFLEIPSTMTMLRGMKGTRNLLTNKGTLSKIAASPITEVTTEAAQEAINFISSEEARRNADRAISGEERDTGGYWDRVTDDYLQNPELWTASFFGAVGGGVFSAYEGIESKISKQGKLDSARKRVQADTLKSVAALKEDKNLAEFADDKALFENSYQHFKDGTFGEYLELLDHFESKSDEELSKEGISKDKIKKTKEKAIKLEDRFLEIESEFGTTKQSELGKDFNKLLLEAEMNLERDTPKYETELNRITELKNKIILETPKENRKAVESYLYQEEIAGRLKTLGGRKGRLQRNLNNINNKKRKSSRQENRRTITSQIKKIDQQMKSLNALQNKEEIKEIKGLQDNKDYKALVKAEESAFELEGAISNFAEQVKQYSSPTERNKATTAELINVIEQQVIDESLNNATTIADIDEVVTHTKESKDMSSTTKEEVLAKAETRRQEILDKTTEPTPAPTEDKEAEAKFEKEKKGKDSDLFAKAEDTEQADGDGTTAPFSAEGEKSVYETFVDTGEVPSTTINTIANKIKNAKELSPEETAMYAAKGTEVEARLREIKSKITTPKVAAPPTSKENTEKVIQEVLKNKDFIKGLTKEGKIVEIDSGEDYVKYKNISTGQEYERVTAFIQEEGAREIPKTPLLKSSQVIGNKVDKLVRDFFADDLQPLEEYGLSDSETMTAFIESLKVIKANLKANGETVVANDIVLYNDEIGAAGTVDLLTYDNKGVVRIYDMKSKRSGVTYIDSTTYGKPDRQSWTDQLNLYRILLNNTHGLQAKSIGVMPIKVNYNPGDTATTELKLLKGVPLKITDTVSTATLKPTSSTSEPQSTIKKEPLHSVDFFSRLILNLPGGVNAEASAALQAILINDPNWKDKVRVIANKDFVSSVKPINFNKATETDFFMDNERILDMSVQVLTEDGWVAAGYIDNPNKYVYGKGKEVIDFTSMTFAQFNEYFIPSESSEFDVFTETDFNQLQAEQQKLRSFKEANEKIFDATGEIDITSSLNLTKDLVINKGNKIIGNPTLASIEAQGGKVLDIIDTSEYKGIISETDNYPISARMLDLKSRYIAKVQFGDTVIDVRLRPIQTSAYTSLPKKLNDVAQKLEALTEHNAKNEALAREYIKGLNLFIAERGKINITLRGQYVKDNYKLIADITYDDNDAGAVFFDYGNIKSNKSINNQINIHLLQRDIPVTIDEKSFRKSIPLEVDVSNGIKVAEFKENFEALVGETPINKAVLRADYRMEEVEKTEHNTVSVDLPPTGDAALFATSTSVEEELLELQDIIAEKTAKGQDVSKERIRLEQLKEQGFEEDEDAFASPLKTTEELAKEEGSLEEGLMFINENLPDSLAPHVSELTKKLKDGRIVLGDFAQGVINLYKGAGKSTAYHESFHAVFRAILTPTEHRAVLEAARSKYTITEADVASLRGISETYNALSYEELVDIALEEKMAEEFEQYVLTKETRSIFKKIYDAIIDFFNIFESNPVDTLFENIRTGAFKNSPIQRKNGMLLPEVPLYKLLEGGISATDSNNLINTIAAKTVNHLKEGKVSSVNNAIQAVMNTEFDLYSTGKITNEATRKRYVSIQKALIERKSKAMIKSEVNRLLESYNFNEIEKQIEDSDDDITFENFDLSIAESGGQGDKEVKKFIALTLYKENNTNIERAINSDGIHALFLRALSGKGVEEQLKIMELLSRRNREVAAVYNKFLTEFPSIKDGNTDIPFLTRFEKAYERIPIKYQITLQNPDDKTIQVINANQKDVKDILRTRWETYFTVNIAPVLAARKSTKNVDKARIVDATLSINNIFNKDIVTEEELLQVESDFATIGLDISVGYLEYSLNVGGRTSDIEGIPKLDKKSIRYITQSIQKNKNPFLGTREKGRIDTIAEYDSIFRNDLIESSFQDAANKTRYAYVLPNHLLGKTSELSNFFLNEENIEAAKKDDYLKHNYFFTLENDQIQNIFRNLEAVFAGDIRETSENTIGKTFKNTDDKAFLLNQLALHINTINTQATGNEDFAHYMPMVYSDKSTMYSFKLPKMSNLYNGGITVGTVNTYYNTVFQQEFDLIHRVLEGKEKEIQNINFANVPFIANNPVIIKSLGIKMKNGQITAMSKAVLNPALIKKAIADGLNKHINDYTNLLISKGIIGGTIKDGLTNILLPNTVKNTEVKDLIGNFMLSSYINSISISQLIQGDLKVAKDRLTRVKRNTGEAGFGPSMGKGKYAVEYYTETELWINPKTGEESTTEKPDYIKVNKDDGQAYSTLTRKMYIMEKGLGRITKNQKEFMTLLDLGLLTRDQANSRTLPNGTKVNIDLSPDKLVHYEDGKVYHKMSVLPLTRLMTSYVPKKDKSKAKAVAQAIYNKEFTERTEQELREELESYWIPFKGKERLHNKRVYMEINNIDELLAESASKQYNEKAIKSTVFDNPTTTVLSKYTPKFRKNQYQRLQVETDSSFGQNNRVIDPTQLELLIDTELPADAQFMYNGVLTSVEDLRGIYNNLLTERLSIGVDNLFKQIKIDENGNKDITSFVSKVRDSIEASGGSPQLLELLESDGFKDFKYDTNLPHIAKKVQQLFLAHFKNGGFSNKTAGYKATLISDDGYNVMRTSAGEIVDVDTFLASPEDFTDVTSGKLKIHRNIDGEIQFAEVAMTRKQADYLGLKVGDVTSDLLEMLGTRIPTQTHHSMMPFKVVEFLPEYMGDSIIAPSEVTYYSGADYDIDKLFILRKDFYVRNGIEQIVYGSATNIEEKWEEFKAYEIANNKELTKLVKNKRLNSEEYQKLVYKDITETINYEDVDLSLFETLNINQFGINPEVSLKAGFDRGFLSEAMRELGLPSDLEAFEDYGNQTSIGAINNSILDLKKSILLNPKMTESLFTPATTKGLEDDGKAIKTILGEETEVNAHYSPLDIYSDWKANATGSRNIGIAASANKVIAVLTKLKASINQQIDFNGVSYNSFDRNLEDDIILKDDGSFKTKKNVRRKADTISTLVSAMTDNGKTLLAGILNLSRDMLGVASTMVGLGIGRTRSMVLVNQPILKTLADRINAADSEINSSGISKKDVLDGLITDAYQKLPKETKASVSENGGEVDFTFTDEELVNGLLETSPELNYKILKFYEYISSLGSEMFQVNSIISLNKGVSGDLEALDRVIENIEALELANNEGTSLMPNIYTKLMSYPQYEKSVELLRRVDDMTSEFFIEKTDTFARIHDWFNDSVGNDYKKEFTGKLKSGIMSFLSVKALESFKSPTTGLGLDLSTMNYLLYPKEGSKTLAAEHLNNLKDKKFANNLFVKAVEVTLKGDEKNKTGYDYLETNTRIKATPEYTEELIAGYEELAKKENYPEYAKKVFRYLIVKEGLHFKQGSLVSIISPKVFKHISDVLKEFNRLTDRDRDAAFSRIGITPVQFRDEFGALFFEDVGNQNVIRNIGNASLQKVAKVILSDDKNTMQLTLKPKQSFSFPKYFKYNNQINRGTVQDPNFRNEGGLFKRVSSKEGDTVIYEKVSTKGNIYQSSYHNSPKSHAEVDALRTNTMGTVLEETSANATFNVMEKFDEDIAEVTKSMELPQEGAAAPKGGDAALFSSAQEFDDSFDNEDASGEDATNNLCD